MTDVVIKRDVAYTAALVRPNTYVVVIVEKDVPGFVVDPSEPTFTSYRAADERASQKNVTLGLDKKAAWEFVASAMSASRFLGQHWEPRGS